MKQLTIIICTHNRAELLKDCLQSFTEQNTAPTAFDVLIVDNASTDETKKTASEFCKTNSNFSYCFEAATGLSIARNRGFQDTASDWIAYIDDDAKAAPDLVERILYTIAHYDFDAFGGIYLPWYRYGKKKWMDNERFFTNKPGMPLEAGELRKGYFSGGNCVFSRSALQAIGGFNTGIGMRGNIVSYGEETLAQVQLRKLGKKIGFDPRIIIYHVVMPYKLSLRWFFKALYRNGIDHWDTFDEVPSRKKLRSAFYNGSKNFIRNFFACLPRIFRKDYYFQNWVIDVFCEYGRVWGMIKGGKQKLRRT